ncbi:hypothetical protein Tco_1531217 [Tanacetum coccineum]
MITVQPSSSPCHSVSKDSMDDDDDVLGVLGLDSSVDEMYGRKSLEVMCTSKDMLGLIVKLVRYVFAIKGAAQQGSLAAWLKGSAVFRILFLS